MQHAKVWNKTLGSSEKVAFEFSVSKRYQVVCFAFWAVVSLILLTVSVWATVAVLLVAAFYYFFYLKVANAYAFTDHRVLVHTGWLSTKMITTEYQKITDVTVEEPFLDRLIYRTGKLMINTAGSKGEEMVLKRVDRPYELKKKLDALRGQR